MFINFLILCVYWNFQLIRVRLFVRLFYLPNDFVQAKKYMKIGYDRQNELYRHSDGSYSIWGPARDPSSQGSMWLTTFVVKAYSQV